MYVFMQRLRCAVTMHVCVYENGYVLWFVCVSLVSYAVSTSQNRLLGGIQDIKVLQPCPVAAVILRVQGWWWWWI